MPDWLESMQQSFEYCVVDPVTWRDKQRLTNVKSCSISRSTDSDTLGSANIDVTETVGESYIRIYLVTIQNGLTERHPLGTFLVQTPSSQFDGRVRAVTMDAYTPLLELSENPPPIGYYVAKGSNIMATAYEIVKANVRAPVLPAAKDDELYYDFVADASETWLSFVKDLIANARYSFDLDEMGRILFAPDQDTASLQPVWTYDDGDKSILHMSVSMSHDLYDVPNVIEVVYSKDSENICVIAENTDPDSPTSIQNRGRKITHRITDPDINNGIPDQRQLQEYAERILEEMSTVEYTFNYTHAYCPVRVGDCVRINYSMAGLTNVKAKVVSQNIKCEPGCPVQETAIFTTKLWR